MYFDPQYLVIMIVALILGFVTQGYVNRAYRRWSQVQLATGRSGAQVARAMLDSEGLQGVGIEMIPGNLTDHYDPKANVLRLSEDVFSSTRSPRPASLRTRRGTRCSTRATTRPRGSAWRSCRPPTSAPRRRGC